MTRQEAQPSSVKAIAALPADASLAEWQTFISRLIDEKGFTRNTNEVFVKFTEEVGELAKELRKRWRSPEAEAPETAGGELADVLFYLLDLANHFGVDLEAAARQKLAANENRHWLD
jgi:NTP pyrophosphatase (non-canonical NTP hydrolase)